MIMYKDFTVLLKDIRKHNKNSNISITIKSCDDPFKLAIGWTCLETNTTWGIKIHDLKKWLLVNNLDGFVKNNNKEIIRHCIKTLEGKKLLANIFSNVS